MANLSSFVTGQAASASIEKSYIRAPDTAVGSLWVASGPGVAITTEGLLANLPEGSNKKSALKLLRTSGTDYVRYRFTLDQADSGKTFKIFWNQIYSGLAGDFTLSVFSYTDGSYTGGATNLNAAASSIPSTTGSFQTTVAMPSFAIAPYIEIRINAVSGVTPLYLSGVAIGPGVTMHGATVSDWQTYVPSLAGITVGNGLVFGRYRRVGSNMEVYIGFASGTTSTFASSNWSFSIPSGFNIDSIGTTVNRIPYGVAYTRVNDGSDGNDFGGVVTYLSPNTVQVALAGAVLTPTATSEYFNATSTGATNNLQNTILNLNFSIPIAEWVSSGTTLLSGPVSDVEYAFNTSTSTNTTDSVSFGNGPQGAQIQAITTGITRRVRFQYPIQSDDLIIVEVSEDRVKWFQLDQPFYGTNASAITCWTNQNGQTYGFGRKIPIAGSATDLDIGFGAYSINLSTYAAAGTAWGATSGACFWRVRKAKAIAPVGISYNASVGGSGFIVSTKNANFVAASLNHYLVDTTTTAVTATLPNGTASATIKFSDDARTWSSKTFTIQPATGEKIDGLAINESVVADVTGASIQLTWDGLKWVIDTNALATNLVGGSSGTGGLAPTAITTTTTAVKGKYYLANTSGGAFTVTLPAGSTDAYIRIADANDTWGTNGLTVTPATGEQIAGYAANDSLLLNVSGSWADFAWNGSRWVLSSPNTSTVLPATSTTFGTVSGGNVPGSVTAIAAGFIGEVRSKSITASTTLSAANGAFQNAVFSDSTTALTLTTGVWAVTASAYFNGGNISYIGAGISTDSVSASFSDQAIGQNRNIARQPTAAADLSVWVSPVDIVVTGATQDVFLKLEANYTVAPAYRGRLRAQRIG